MRCPNSVSLTRQYKADKATQSTVCLQGVGQARRPAAIKPPGSRPFPGSVLFFIDQAIAFDPRHHGAQFLANHLNFVLTHQAPA